MTKSLRPRTKDHYGIFWKLRQLDLRRDLTFSRKYVLLEVEMLRCKPADTVMGPNLKLWPNQGELLKVLGRYKRSVGKLRYLRMTRPDIACPVNVVSMSAPRTSAVIKIL